MKHFLLYFLIILLSSCNYTPKKVTSITDHCFNINNYNKTICLESKYDSIYPVIFVDKMKLERGDNKYTDLKMYVMMVVEIKGENVTLSNINYSITIKVKGLNKKGGFQMKIQDIYYVITKRIFLSDSKIVIRSNGIKEEIYDNRHGGSSPSMNINIDGYDQGNGYDDESKDIDGRYEDIEDP